MRKVVRTKSNQVAVTKAMLFQVRNEMKEFVGSKFQSLESKFHDVKSDVHAMKSDIHDIRSDMHAMKSDIHAIKSDMHGMKSDIHAMKSDIHAMKADIHGMKLLVEEQAAQNRIVLDGLNIYFDRTARVEDRMDNLEQVYRPKK